MRNHALTLHAPCSAVSRPHGFSLIEMIGLLAVVLILALTLAFVSTKSLDTVASNQEAANLQNFASSLQNSI